MRKRYRRQARHQGQQHNNNFYGAHKLQNLNLGVLYSIRRKHGQGYKLMNPRSLHFNELSVPERPSTPLPFDVAQPCCRSQSHAQRNGQRDP